MSGAARASVLIFVLTASIAIAVEVWSVFPRAAAALVIGLCMIGAASSAVDAMRRAVVTPSRPQPLRGRR